MRLGGLVDWIRGPKLFGQELASDPGRAQSVTGEEAENLITTSSADLVAIVLDRLQAEDAAQAEQPAQETAQLLLRQLAVTRIRADFESIYAHVYGSQIAVLRTLRATPTGATRETLEPHLAQVKRDLKLASWIHGLSFEAWLGYLLRNDLVEIGPDDLYRIATKGAGFIDYVEGLGYPPKTF
jgi:hypothetical protein